ncbi:MAG: ComF family protein [Deltaproteobacteria bacterium]|nr:ComF family protein [Candidatus Tharpella sp.]
MNQRSSYLSVLFDIIAPRTCLLCSQFLSHPLATAFEKESLENYLCSSCRNQLEICERSFASGRSSRIDKFFSGYQYTGSIARIIPAWKYHRRNEFFPLIKILIYLTISRLNLLESDFNLVLAVPLSRKTLRKRDFNQALFIAACSSFALGLPLVAGQLVKNIHTPQQASLDRHARAYNLTGDTFGVIDPEVVRGRNVLLCDDVLTTGATLDTVAGTLRSAGAVSVTALTLARVEL